MITSPYNFVPLHDSVFRPEWGEPSHDCPFSDAVAGELCLTLTAKTPVYVRGNDPKPETINLQTWENANPLDSSAFGKWAEFYRNSATGKYAIPGTTLKGVIRNLLKIASFGSIDYADDDFISVRDLSDAKYTGKITKPGPGGSCEANVRGGWLRKNPDRSPGASEWVITPSKVARVEQRDLGLPGAGGVAERKYKVWDGSHTDRSVTFDLPATSFADGYDIHRRRGRDPLFYAKASGIGCGTQTGTVIFTGQAGRKHMEFIFYEDDPVSIPVAPIVQKKFKDTHPEGKNGNEGWRYWRKELESPGGRVPVFWIENTIPSPDQPEERIVAFGLAQMFRLPARSLHDAIPPQHKGNKRSDVADRLFGFVRDKEALRGRVAFSALNLPYSQSNAHVRFGRVVTAVLGAPRPTFYPAYLEQPDYTMPNGKLVPGTDASGQVIPPKRMYQTWLSPEVRIRGWKRYPVAADAPADQPETLRLQHPEAFIPTQRNGQANYDVATAFWPLKGGSAFSGSVRFHNLRRAELGALIWALTWGGDPRLRHSIGMGKSLGMGSCVMEVEWNKSTLIWCGDPAGQGARLAEKAKNDSRQRQVFAEECRDEFVVEMNRFISDWINSPPMCELLAMANPANATSLTGHEKFPPLRPVQPGILDFRGIKEQGFALPRTTEIISHRVIKGRQNKSGNPPLPDPNLLPSSEDIPPVPPAVLPPPPVLNTGQHAQGTLVAEPAEPGKPGGNRIYFSPDEHPEMAGNAGIKVNNDRGAVIGQRWTATVFNVKPPAFKLLSKL